ncbi:MAG: DUF962 domain-containing protein [Candidatus Saccharibacteria bacterium]|nr:DUF962 domain-containing protein [Moraxellaceae bacterium]
MRTLQDWLTEYSISHQNPINKRLHWICVPLITVSVIGMLWSLSSVAALFALILAMIFYARLSITLFAVMASFSSLIVVLIWILAAPLQSISPYAALGFYFSIFVVGWIGQFYGHKVEGKKPSFFKDLQFLLIGPAWCAEYLMKKIAKTT